MATLAYLARLQAKLRELSLVVEDILAQEHFYSKPVEPSCGWLLRVSYVSSDEPTKVIAHGHLQSNINWCCAI
jgi:hypothetical protein